jgi:Transposase IS66 family
MCSRKGELLMVLDRPEIPLHTNGSENDIRCHLTKRKVSGGTRSDAGRDCRAFLSLSKTCAKLGIASSNYLGHARSAKQPQNPLPAHTGRSPLRFHLTAPSFAPLTGFLAKRLILLVPAEGFEPPTP